MKNSQQWRSSKYVRRRGKLVASRNPKEVFVSSRLFVDIVARFYDIHIKDHCRGRLLDIGCGKVPLYEVYREHVDEIVCIDWSEDRNEFVDCACDLEKPLPFEDAEFNTLILSDVLEHIPTPQCLWHEMSRILATGGSCLINVPFFYGLHEEPYDFYRYTRHALRRFAEKAGFEVLVLETMGGTPEIIADLLAKHFYFGIPFFGRHLASIVQSITRLFVSTSVGSRISRKTGEKFPLGYFMIVKKLSLDSVDPSEFASRADAGAY